MSKFDMETLAANLRGQRAMKRVSQADVAQAIGQSQGAVQKWENAENVPSVDSVFALADYYGVGIDALCGFKPAA